MQDLELDNQRRTQLDANIRKMLEGGATKDDVMKYASDFKNQFGLKKKVGVVKSLTTSSPTPSQGEIKITGGLTPLQPVKKGIEEVRPTAKGIVGENLIAQAIEKDKIKEDSYFGAVWNNLIGSAQRLAGGIVRAESFGDPVSLALRSSDEKYGTNLAQLREMALTKGAKDLIGNLRTDTSSKENENKIIEGFDITDGIGWKDLKALGVMIPSMVADMGLGAATMGTTFAIQGYDDALTQLDKATKDKPVDPLTRQIFGLGGATVTAALEKVGLDNIIKVPALKKYAISKIVNETADELIEKGVKVTADQFEKTVLKNAENFAKKEAAKRTIQGATRGLVSEGSTEALQEGGMDLMKLAANKLENLEIFDEDEMKDTIAQRYLNSFAVGGLLGSAGGAAFSRFGNTERAIEESLKKAKTPEEIKSIIEQVNANIESGAIPPENAEAIAPIIEKYTTTIQPSEVRKPEIVEKGNKFEQGQDGKFTAYKKGEAIVDESGAPIKFDTIEEAKEAVRLSETKPKGEPEQISQPIELSIDETTQTTEIPVKTEAKVGEPKTTTETIGTTEVTEAEPIQEKVTVRRLSGEEPPMREGVRITTLSGMTEPERTSAIEQRKKETKVSDKVMQTNDLVMQAKSYFDKGARYANSAEGRAKLNELRAKAREMGLEIDPTRNAVVRRNEKGRITKVAYNSKAEGDAVIDEKGVVLVDRDRGVQEAFEELTDNDVFLDITQENGTRMSAAQVDATIQDILNGIPSKRANRYLDMVEKATKENAYPLYDKTLGEFAPSIEELRSKLGVEKETVGEPMDETSLLKFLEEESQLTPEEEAELLDNIENLLYEYEPNIEEGIEAEVSEPQPATEAGVSTKTKPIAEVEETKPRTTETAVEPPKPPTAEDVDAMELDRTTSLEHAATEQKRAELGLPERTAREVKTDVALNEQADQAIKDGYNVKGLINKINAGYLPTDVEHMILTKYAAGLESKLKTLDPKSKEFEETFKEINKTYKASEKGGSELGAAFRARQNRVFQEDELGEMLVREAEVNQVEDLTEDQRAKVVDEFNAIKKAKEEWEKKYNELVEEQRKKDAKAEIDKAKKPSSQKKSKEDYVKEREKLKESIKEKWNKAANDGTLTAVPIPYAKQLANVAPDVAKLMRSYVEEGVTELADVIKNIHNDLKGYIPEIQESDVRDIIAGVYNEKRTRNEIAASLRDLRDEAKLIKQLEDLKNGVEPTNERAKIERNKKITELRAKIKSLKQEDVEAERELRKQEKEAEREAKRQEKEANKKSPEQIVLDRIKTRTQKEIAELEEKLSKGDYAKEAKKEPVQLDKEAIELKNKLIKLKQEREVRLMQQEYANRTKWQKIKDTAIEVLNVPRTVMASVDLSAPLRQGIIPTISNPKLAGKAFVEMLKQAVSQKRFDRWFYDLRNSPIYTVMDESGLYIADPHDPKLSAKEERFMNNIAEEIPVAGKIIKGSERAHVSYLNKMRADLFIQGVQAFEADGKTMKNSPELYKSLAGWINNATGRGKMAEPLEKAAPILNTAFFSPRLMAARINTLNPAYYAKMPKEVRMMALKDMGTFIGFGMSMLALAALSGADVELDPRSTDFGKIKIGDTRYDIWGGFQQYVVEFSQLMSGKTKSATTGQIRELSSKTFPYKTRLDDAMSFVRGKLAPIPASAMNLLSGKKVTGERTDIFKEMKGWATPLMISDSKEAFERDGIVGALATGIPATFGIGVQTLSTLPKGAKTGDKVWDFISDKKVRVPNPDVEAMKVGKDKREMTDEEIEKFNEIRLKKLESGIENLMKKGYNIVEKGNVKFKKAEDLTQEQLQDRIESISRKATSEAKEELFGKEQKTPQEKRQERIAERLNKKIS